LCEIEEQKHIIDSLEWIEIRSTSDLKLVEKLALDLDAGESEAIALAIELKADFLIIDELIGRKIAESFGIKIVGLLGTLLRAKEKGFINSVSQTLDSLSENAGFHISPKLRRYVLDLAGET
jgi:predicted nucleic acid-binding protein